MALTPYTKTNWVERVRQFASRFVLSATGAANEYNLTRVEGNVTQTGTPLSIANLNKMEQGIYDVTAETISNKDTMDAHLADTTKYHDKGFNLDLARCYMENVKHITTFQADGIYSSVTGAQSVDTTNVKIGSQSIRIVENDNIASLLNSNVPFSSALNLTLYNDGSAISSDDYVRVVFYISDVSKVDTSAGVSILFATSSSHYYSLRLTTLVTGWNYIDVKIAYIPVGLGSPNWNNINSLYVGWTSLANAINVYVSFQYVAIVRKDPLSMIPNPFQHRENGVYVRDFAIGNGFWFLGMEFGELVVSCLSGAYNSTLTGQKTYTDFIHSVKFTAKGTSTDFFRWSIDSANYVAVFAWGGNLQAQKSVAGNTTSLGTICSISMGDEVLITLCKNGSSFIFRAIKNGITYEISNETTNFTTSNGRVLIFEGGGSYVPSRIEAISMTSIEYADHATRADFADSVGCGVWQKLQPDIVMTSPVSQADILITGKRCTAYKIIYSLTNATQNSDLSIVINGLSSGYEYTFSKNNGTTITPVKGSNQSRVIVPTGLSLYNGAQFGEILFIDYKGYIQMIINAQGYDGSAIWEIRGIASKTVTDSLTKISVMPAAGTMSGMISIQGLR